MRFHSRTFIFLFALCAAAPLRAQTPPPVHPIGPVLATSTEPFASVSQVRALPGGRVIMHDLTGRRVVMLDSTFKHVTVIADTTNATVMAYGSRLGGIIAYRGDSTLFIDPQSISMLVIDPAGKIGRTMAAPLPNEVNQLIGGQNGTPGFDAQGRLVYRARLQLGPGAQRFAGAGAFAMPVLPDSSYVVRVDLKTRKVDTAAVFRIPKIGLSVSRDDNTGGISVITTVNPMPWTDDWALLSDGTLAVVRGQDYRVDFIAADGKVTSTPKLPFEWQRLTDEDKAAVIDSARGQMDKIRAAQIAQAQSMNANITVNAPDTSKGARQRPQGDGSNATIMVGGRGGGGGGLPVNFSMPPVSFVSPSEMPDYRPAFRQGAALGDLAGNLWIRTSKSVNGGTVYDVVSSKGELTDRVLIPPGRVIAGFGPGGVVYMGVVDGNITHLERARVR